MRKIFSMLIILFFVIFNNIVFSQNQNSSDFVIGGEVTFHSNDSNAPCISNEQYSIISNKCVENIANLKKDGLINSKDNKTMAAVKLNWPLQPSIVFSDYSYYFVSAYVDQNKTTGVYQDWNCGSRTYDGHGGTDIGIWPFPFNKVDNSQVEVIAAAAGTIIDKHDGEYDRNCVGPGSGLQANYIIIQHSDGSVALYWHVKKNSITTKAIGQTVIAGEIIAIVASSGSSSGPHLHFEVWSGTTASTRVDPFYGTCNSLNSSSLWISQKQYSEPAVIKASVHTRDYAPAACPNSDSIYESSFYSIPFSGQGLPANYAKFFIFSRDVASGTKVDFKILNPDKSILNSWEYTYTSKYSVCYVGWTKLLPTKAGIYTFETSYNNLTYSKTFEVAETKITPLSNTTFCQGGSVILSASSGVSYLWSNGETTQNIVVKSSGNYSVTIKNSSGALNTSPIVTVTVNPLPIASITPNGKISICQNEVLILSATPATSYLWSNGETTQNIKISQSGDYFVKITNENACSSTSNTVSVTINLKPDKSITASNNTLTANQSNAVYQWLDCSNSFSVIIGETKQSFSAKKSGNYAVKISLNNCSDTSTCSLVSIEVKVTSISLNKKISTLKIGDSINIISTILPPNATNKNVSWSSSDSKIASVTNSGLIKALSLGTAKLIVKTIEGNFSDTCNVNIVNNEIHVLQVFINRKMDTLYLGNNQKDTAQLSSVLYPSDATNSIVNWFSTDSSIASVNQNGLVKAQNIGKTFIYVKTNDGNKTDTCFITVLIPTDVEENNFNDNIIVLPNPVSDILYISIPNTQFFLIEISNIIGQTVFKSENKTRLDLSNIPKGNYLLKVKIKDQCYIKKFVKD